MQPPETDRANFVDKIAQLLEKLVTFPRSYILSILLALGSAALWSMQGSGYSLRGGLISHVLFYVVTLSVGILAIAGLLLSRLRRPFKFGLTVLHAIAVGVFGVFIAPLLFIALFFGPGICYTTFTSPSGRQSISIEDACFMDCTHTVLRNEFMFQKEVGQLYLDGGKVCRLGSKFVVQWNADETAFEWQAGDRKDTIQVN